MTTIWGDLLLYVKKTFQGGTSIDNSKGKKTKRAIEVAFLSLLCDTPIEKK